MRKADFESISAAEAIQRVDLDGQHVAVRGLLFCGDPEGRNEFLLLPRTGPFDGLGTLEAIGPIDRRKSILVDEPSLLERVGSFGGFCGGSFIYKHDTVVIGRLSRCPRSDHGARITDLWLLVAQQWTDYGRGRPSHDMWVVNFPQERLPRLPWAAGGDAPGGRRPFLRLFPFEANETED